jgi:pimeloyl-ACP methyl ester carboxylesterase
VWRKAVVDSRPALYGEAGEGIPVLFLHGWALGHHSYKPALKRLIGLGCHVWAPALPGFGGTPELPTSHFSFAGYAGWVERFCEVVGIEGSVVVVGHSFGGGVGIQLTHDVPDRVKQLVLLNSVGGQAWLPDRNRSMAERPLWDWGLHFPGDVLALSKLTRMVPVFLEDAIPNVVRSPRALWRVAQLARKADLTEELRDLQARDAKVTVLWSDKDEIIPRASFEDLCAALGIEGEVIPGSHSWLLADPGAFAEIMSRVLGLEAGARQSAGPPAAG